MQESYEYFQRASKVFPGGVNSPVRAFKPYPLFMKEGKGPTLTDVDGRNYTDYCLAFGPLILGHGHGSLKNALSESIESGVGFGTPTEDELLLGEKIVSAIPGLEKIRFASSGTEATMHAIRTARAYSGKKIIVKAEGCFHGSHDYVLVKAGSGALTHGTPSSPGIPDEVTSTVRVAQFNDIESYKDIFKSADKNNVAAVIVEPVMGNVGVIPPEKEFLKALRELTEDNGSLLIFDEVITGFRFHFGAYSTQIRVKPDITVLGKIIGGGLPVGAIGGPDEIMKEIAPSGPIYMAGTYSGNLLTMRAGLQTLRILEKMDYDSLNVMVANFAHKVHEIMASRNLGSINQVYSMFQLFFGSPKVRNYGDAMGCDRTVFGRFFEHCLKNNIYVASSMFETNFVSFAHTKDQLDYFAEVLEDFADHEST